MKMTSFQDCQAGNWLHWLGNAMFLFWALATDVSVSVSAVERVPSPELFGSHLQRPWNTALHQTPQPPCHQGQRISVLHHHCHILWECRVKDVFDFFCCANDLNHASAILTLLTEHLGWVYVWYICASAVWQGFSGQLQMKESAEFWTTSITTHGEPCMDNGISGIGTVTSRKNILKWELHVHTHGTENWELLSLLLQRF